MRILIVLFLTIFSNIALGQNYRKGLLFGFGTGVSRIKMNFPDKSITQFGPAINWKIGYSVSPKTAILLNGTVSIYDFDLSGRNRKRDFGGLMPSVQHWIGPKTWILSGAGLGTEAPVFYDLKTENKEETNYYTGFGTVAAIGYEFFQKKNFTIDLQGRLNYSSVNLPIGKTNGLSFGLIFSINFY